MKSHRRVKLIIVIAGALALTIIALPDRAEQSSEIASAVAPVNAPELAGVLGVCTSQQLATQQERARSLTWGRDLFAPPATSVHGNSSTSRAAGTASSALPRFTGVSHRSGEFLALIDGELVAGGARLGSGYDVINIDRHTVTLSRGRERVTLTLGEE